MKQTIKVMLVDDSAVVRQTLREVLESDPQIEVVNASADPIFAQKHLETMRPDVIITDVEMPRMDGLTFLRSIMETAPLPVVVCSSKTEEGSENAIKALEYGAVEIIQKPKLGTKQFIEESKVRICDAVKAAYLSRNKLSSLVAPARPEAGRQRSLDREVSPKLTADVMLPKPEAGRVFVETTEKVVVVGASTGGTEAIKDFLLGFPADCPPTLIVQHMPENFTASFARRLDSLCEPRVVEAQGGERVEPGTVYIAPGHSHLQIRRQGSAYVTELLATPAVNRHRPSVDVLFDSAAQLVGKQAVGVILTGMGKDGAQGLLRMRQAGARTFGQDEASCVVYGMPREAALVGAVEEVVSLDGMSRRVLATAARVVA